MASRTIPRPGFSSAACVALGLLLVCLLLPPVLADTGITAGAASPSPNVTLYFFEAAGCIHCERAQETIQAVMAKYPDIHLVDFEITTNATGRRLFEEVNLQYGVANPGVPTVLVGKQVLVGDVAIAGSLEQVVRSEREGTGNLSPAVPATAGVEPPTPVIPTAAGITIPLVLTGALVDGLNPCALAVLVFLVVTITALGDRRKALTCGVAYTVAVFFLYFLAGFGIFSGIRASGFGKEIYLLAAIIATVFGILSLRDALSPAKRPLLKIPEAADRIIRSHAMSASLPAAFVLGLLVGLFELPCTGAIYFSVLNLLGNTMTFGEGVAFLALYNLIFILPLLVVIALVYRGLPVSDAEEWRTRNMRRLRLVSGIVLVMTGLVMLVLVR